MLTCKLSILHDNIIMWHVNIINLYVHIIYLACLEQKLKNATMKHSKFTLNLTDP